MALAGHQGLLRGLRQSCPLSTPSTSSPCCSSRPWHSRSLFVRHAVEKDVESEVQRPATAPPKSSFTRPPPPPPPPTPDWGWVEAPFRSRRNIALTMLGGASLLWLYNKKVLPPVEIGQPPADFPFKLAGYTDVAPEEFVYAKTPGGNWLAAAQDTEGRIYMIDQVGDLYYDSGNPNIGLYVVDTQGNMFNIYQDVDGARRVTPVGNISQLRRFKVSEIAGIKFEQGLNVVALEDGSTIPLPPGAGSVDEKGNFVPPKSLVEGYWEEQDNPFARLLAARKDRPFPMTRYEVDPADPTPFDRQIFDQTLLDDPDIPGYQPALPEDFDYEAFKKEVEQESRRRR